VSLLPPASLFPSYPTPFGGPSPQSDEVSVFPSLIDFHTRDEFSGSVVPRFFSSFTAQRSLGQALSKRGFGDLPLPLSKEAPTSPTPKIEILLEPVLAPHPDNPLSQVMLPPPALSHHPPLKALKMSKVACFRRPPHGTILSAGTQRPQPSQTLTAESFLRFSALTSLLPFS